MYAKLSVKIFFAILTIFALWIVGRSLELSIFGYDKNLDNLICKQVEGNRAYLEFESMDVVKRKVHLNMANFKNVSEGEKKDNKESIIVKLINDREITIYFNNNEDKKRLINALKSSHFKEKIEINI